MNAETGTTEAAVSRILRLNPGTAPSLRVPVTAGNRDLLRWLRAAELSAWQEGHVWMRASSPANPASPATQHN